MIQRKQSIWLLIAALLCSGVFYFDLYKYHTVVSAVDTTGQLRVMDHFPSLLLAIVMTALPLVTIFMFRQRKRQIAMSFFGVVAIAGFITMSLQRVKYLGDLPVPPTSQSYGLGTILPVAAVVFLFLAITGIRKDDKLVKSVDRLR
jgi:hypothetical protein